KSVDSRFGHDESSISEKWPDVWSQSDQNLQCYQYRVFEKAGQALPCIPFRYQRNSPGYQNKNAWTGPFLFGSLMTSPCVLTVKRRPAAYQKIAYRAAVIPRIPNAAAMNTGSYTFLASLWSMPLGSSFPLPSSNEITMIKATEIRKTSPMRSRNGMP